MFMEDALRNAILKWFDDSLESWESINDAEWINYVCNETGITKEEYNRIMN